MESAPLQDRTLIAVTRDGRFRARVARLTGVVGEACRRHGATGLVAEALARALGCVAVYPTNWKDAERIAVQWSGPGPLRTLMAEARPGRVLRAYAAGAYAGKRIARDGYRGIGHGLGAGSGFVNVIRQEAHGAFAQSRVPLKNGEVDEDLEAWFRQSEQAPTMLRVLTGPEAGGVPRETSAVIVQLLPRAGPEDLPATAVMEGMGADAPLLDLLDAAVEGRPVDLLAEEALKFQCNCSKQRIAAGLALLQVDELLDMINKDRGASVRCDYCATRYTFDREEVEEIMVRKVTGERAREDAGEV